MTIAMNLIHDDGPSQLIETPQSTLSNSIDRPIPIARQVKRFLLDQLKGWSPNFVIVHERKGTATLRALKESPEEPILFPWDRVVSSTAIDEWSPDNSVGRILIFDDMMKTGKHLDDILAQLGKYGIPISDPSRVRVAVFAVHEEAPKSNCGPPHAWFYQGLSSAAYSRIRQELITFLQRSGSLMLDTEHIEVRVKIHCTMNRFVDALRRRAEALVFRSAGDRTNITVSYPDDEAHELPREKFPAGTIFTKIVKKCRIVQRSADEFAIIPICLPAIPVNAHWPLSEQDHAMLGPGMDRGGKSVFYNAALMASLFPLNWVLRDLRASDSASYSLYLPHEGAETLDDGYTLNHLKSMYPTLDVGALVRRVIDTEKHAAREGRLRRTRGTRQTSRANPTDDQLRQDSIRLLQLIGHFVDRRKAEACNMSELSIPAPIGLSAQEIFELGRRMEWSYVHTSTLFDILIDHADLVTRVEKMQSSEGPTWVRTFKPDGEVVSDLIRRYTRQWGLPRGF